jgi:D-arabinose 5-phosphate isomerase GutQ
LRPPQGATLASVREELERQPRELERMARATKLPPAREGSLIVGAGDSYAAAIIAAYLSSFRLLPFDPLALATAGRMWDGREVYFISISGATRSNIETMRLAKAHAKMVVAITSNAKSSLATTADEVIELPFVPAAKSPGIMSFSMSLLIALQLGLVPTDCDFRAAFARAKSLSRLVRAADAGTTFFLGNGPFYGSAIYASAKVYELLGKKAHSEQLEQFSHMELFSLASSDAVNIFQGRGETVSSKLFKTLEERSYACSLVEPKGANDAEAVFTATFTSQMAALAGAERLKMRRPYFVTATDRLRMSDVMIY